MSDTIETRVARGAALLDEREPGWDRLVDVEMLHPLNPHCDLLAQTWRGPVGGPLTPSERHYDALFPDPLNAVASRYGLDGDSRRELDALTAQWTKVILARRGGAS